MCICVQIKAGERWEDAQGEEGGSNGRGGEEGTRGARPSRHWTSHQRSWSIVDSVYMA